MTDASPFIQGGQPGDICGNRVVREANWRAPQRGRPGREPADRRVPTPHGQRACGRPARGRSRPHRGGRARGVRQPPRPAAGARHLAPLAGPRSGRARVAVLAGRPAGHASPALGGRRAGRARAADGGAPGAGEQLPVCGAGRRAGPDGAGDDASRGAAGRLPAHGYRPGPRAVAALVRARIHRARLPRDQAATSSWSPTAPDRACGPCPPPDVPALLPHWAAGLLAGLVVHRRAPGRPSSERVSTDRLSAASCRPCGKCVVRRHLDQRVTGPR